MICSHCGCEFSDAITGVCPECGRQIVAKERVFPQLVHKVLHAKSFAELDFVVLVDRTGSSEAFKTGIPLTYEKIARAIAERVRDPKLYVYSHGDLDLGEETILHTDGGSIEQAIDDVRRIIFQGGGDPEETHTTAIEYVMRNVPWRNKSNSSRSALLVFLTDDTKPCRSGLTAKQLGEELKARRIQLYLVCQPTPTLKELVEAAGGLMFEISNSPDQKDLDVIANKLAASITNRSENSVTTPWKGAAV